MKYTTKDRRLAIRICQIAASDFVHHVGLYTAMSEVFGTCDGDEFDLARAALRECPGVYTKGNLVSMREAWAEAECLLRDGWSPGEPVVRLGGAP